MRILALSVGDSFSSGVTRLDLDWPGLVRQLKTYVTSDETLDQYCNYSKDDQLRLKDRGWWNGSTYSGARRDASQITSLDVLTFDLDNCTPATPNYLRAQFDPMLCDFPVFMGSTRKHSAALPRLRLAIPLSRPVSVDESDALKRGLCKHFNALRLVDPVTFRANQVMFWPSRCSDGEVIAETFGDDSPFLDPDEWLARLYPADAGGWTNRELWPLAPIESQGATAERPAGHKRSDPRLRDDLIGLFCRLFDVEFCIDEFIQGVYLPGTQPHRWTHAGGSTTNGATIYDGGLYLYSHHQTDPACGILCNSWDLVRIHRFGQRDDGIKPGTATSDLPSQVAMREFALDLDAVRQGLADDAMGAFQSIDEPQTDDDPFDILGGCTEVADRSDDATVLRRLFDSLKKNKRGKVEATYDNVLLILEGHPRLGKNLAYNHNIGASVWRVPMPWHDTLQRASMSDLTEGLRFRDNDDMEVRDFMVRQFKGMELPTLADITKLCMMVALRNGFHPIRDAFATLPAWDGMARLDDVFIRYLGCDDTPYTRGVSRKFFCGVVARALSPGCKFDYMPVWIGTQGQGKSTFCEVIAGNPSWFRESLPPIAKMPDVVSAIKSKLICEWSDMHGMSTTEIESIKSFMTSKHDEVRLSYERHTASYPRQCLMIGTANDETLLRDRTGNRRFWPIHVRFETIDHAAFATERDQVLAEAKAAWLAGERLWLEGEAASGALSAQEAAREMDPTEEAVTAWLDNVAPSRAFPAGLVGSEFESFKAAPRDEVCVRKIGCEALGLDENGIGWPPYVKKIILAILRNRTDFMPLPTSRRMRGYGSARAWTRVVASVLVPASNVTPIGQGTHKKSALYDI